MNALALLLLTATSTGALPSPFAADGPGHSTAAVLGGRLLVLTGQDTVPVPMLDFALAAPLGEAPLDLVARAATVGVFSFGELGLRLRLAGPGAGFGWSWATEASVLGALGFNKDSLNQAHVATAVGVGLPGLLASYRLSPSVVWTFGLGVAIPFTATNFGGHGEPFDHVLIRPTATVEFGGWYWRGEAYVPTNLSHVVPSFALGHSL